jgi:hypothetical protein
VTKVTVLELWRRSSAKKQTLDCVATVSKLDVLKPLRLVSSEKQIPQVVENIEKGKSQMGLLEPDAGLRRQTLYPTELRARCM